MPHHFTYQEKMQQGSGSREFSSAAEQHFNLCCFISPRRDEETLASAEERVLRLSAAPTCKQANLRPEFVFARGSVTPWRTRSRKFCRSSFDTQSRQSWPCSNKMLARHHPVISATLRCQRSAKPSRRRCRRWHKHVEAAPMKPGEGGWERNPITRHLEAGCVTNGVWLVMELAPTCSWQERLEGGPPQHVAEELNWSSDCARLVILESKRLLNH